jgi:hypothetical protein
MSEKNKLYILWTNADPITSDKMVFMYGINCKLKEWWDEVTIIVWGATAKFMAENEYIQERIKQALHVGVRMIACKGCSDQLGVSDKLTAMGIEVAYIGGDLTDILKSDETLLTV